MRVNAVQCECIVLVFRALCCSAACQRSFVSVQVPPIGELQLFFPFLLYKEEITEQHVDMQEFHLDFEIGTSRVAFWRVDFCLSLMLVNFYDLLAAATRIV